MPWSGVRGSGIPVDKLRVAAVLIAFGLSGSITTRSASGSGAATSQTPGTLQEIVACLEAREAAMETVSGFVVYDQRMSEPRRRDLRKLLADPRVVIRDSPRTLGVAEFAAGRGLYRMDGVMLTEGAGNPWGLVPQPGRAGEAAANRAVAANGAGSGKGSRPCRTVIMRDGEREARYDEARREQRVAVMGKHRWAYGQDPLAEFLFADQLGQGLSFFLTWQPELPDVPRFYESKYIGDEEIDGAACAKVQQTCYLAAPERPAATTSVFWLARNMSYAPLRHQSLTWFMHPDKPVGRGYLWAAEQHTEVQTGVWLPTRVRIEDAQVSKGEPVQWNKIEVAHFSALELNRPFTREDVWAWKAPMGTHLSEAVEMTPAAERRGRNASWRLAQEWLREEPSLTLEPRFLRFMEECASLGPPKSLPKTQTQPRKETQP